MSLFYKKNNNRVEKAQKGRVFIDKTEAAPEIVELNPIDRKNPDNYAFDPSTGAYRLKTQDDINRERGAFGLGALELVGNPAKLLKTVPRIVKVLKKPISMRHAKIPVSSIKFRGGAEANAFKSLPTRRIIKHPFTGKKIVQEYVPNEGWMQLPTELGKIEPTFDLYGSSSRINAGSFNSAAPKDNFLRTVIKEKGKLLY